MLADPGSDVSMQEQRRAREEQGEASVTLQGRQRDTIEYKVYRRRFLILFVYFLPVFTCGFFMNSFAPISNVYQDSLDDSAFDVAMFANICMIFNILVSFFTPTLYERKGLRFGCWIGSLFLLAGGWIRYFGALVDVGPRCSVIFCGQAVMAIGFPILLAACPLLSNSWYSSDTRAIATAIGSLASIIGSVAASIVGPIFFTDTKGSHVDEVESFLFFQALMASVATLGLALLRDKPPTPPEPRTQATMEESECSAAVGQSVCVALKSGHFRLLMVIFGTGYGSLNAVTTLINDLLTPVNFSIDQIGNIGAALGFGIIGSFVFGALADITKKFQFIAKLCGVFALAGYVAFVILSYYANQNMWGPFIALGVAGFFGIPVVPLLIELGVEALFPLSETVVGSLMWLSGNTIGLVVVLVGAILNFGKGELKMLPAFCFFGAVLLVCMVCLLVYNGPMLRQEHERANRGSHSPFSEAHE